MRKSLGLSVCMIFVGAVASLASEQSWTPNLKTISRLESFVRLPPHAEHRLNQYARYYAGTVVDGRRVIRDLYRYALQPRQVAGIHIVKDTGPLMGLDGGCDFVSLDYDVRSQRI